MGIDLGRFKSGKKNDEWLDWLSDDPVPASIRSRMRQKAVRAASEPRVHRTRSHAAPESSQPVLKQDSPTSSVSINITLPKLKKPRIQIPKRLTRNLRPIAISSLVVVMIGLGVWGATTLKRQNGPEQAADDAKGVLSQQNVKPDFSYNLPKGKDDQVEGSVRFDPQKKVVNFKDSIGGVPIIISQQQLPEGLKDGTQEKVKKLAEEFAATEVLSTANPTAYLGTSAKGPQTVIFAKNDLLVFIQSSKEIDNHDWAEYITGLE